MSGSAKAGTTAERHTCELRVLIASIVRAPPKRASGESFFSLDKVRCACDGRLRVYRTRNAGASWEPLMRGLPQKGAYETVLRDAMTADSLDPPGLYFGTRSGQLYGSNDEGKTWTRILEGLPAVVCVKSAVIGEPRAGRKSKATRAAAARPSRAKPPTRKNKKRRGKLR